MDHIIQCGSSWVTFAVEAVGLRHLLLHVSNHIRNQAALATFLILALPMLGGWMARDIGRLDGSAYTGRKPARSSCLL